MNILLVAVLSLFIIGIIAVIIVAITKAVKTKKLTPRKLVIILLILVIVVGVGFPAMRIYAIGPDVTKVVDTSTKETHFSDIKCGLKLESIFGTVSITSGSISASKFRYADVSFKSSADFNVAKIDGRQDINSIRVYGRISYSDSQKILKHLDTTYGAPYKVTSEDLENGFIHYESFAEQIAKETTCIYPLDTADSIDNISDLEHILRSGNYIILDIVEEKVFGESYYTCQIEWCYTSEAKWGYRVWSEDKPNLIYLSELAGFDN